MRKGIPALLQQITLELGRPLQPHVSKGYEFFSCFETSCAFGSQQKAACCFSTPFFGITDHSSRPVAGGSLEALSHRGL